MDSSRNLVYHDTIQMCSEDKLLLNALNFCIFNRIMSVTLSLNDAGVFNESFMQHILRPDFLVMLEHNTEQMDKWKTKHQGKTPSQSLRESILDHVGWPVYTFLR